MAHGGKTWRMAGKQSIVAPPVLIKKPSHPIPAPYDVRHLAHDEELPCWPALEEEELPWPCPAAASSEGMGEVSRDMGTGGGVHPLPLCQGLGGGFSEDDAVGSWSGTFTLSSMSVRIPIVIPIVILYTNSTVSGDYLSFIHQVRLRRGNLFQTASGNPLQTPHREALGVSFSAPRRPLAPEARRSDHFGGRSRKPPPSPCTRGRKSPQNSGASRQQGT